MKQHRIARAQLAISRRAFLAAAAGVFAAPSARAGSTSQDISFLAIGDWGYPNAAQRNVAAAMGRKSAAMGCQFVITVGDNFYDSGVKSVTDPKWQTNFERAFSAPSLQCPWYPVLGNHDHKGSVEAEIAYSKVSNRWRMPSTYYSRTFAGSDGATAEFFFLDTEQIFRARLGLMSYVDTDQAEGQISWLEHSLLSSTATWKVVVGHHPVFSGGHHGDTSAMIEMVKPLLDRYGVKVYLNGHDHSLQHIVRDGVHYMTVGAGCETDAAHAVTGTEYFSSTTGFLAGRTVKDALRLEFVDSAGQSLHSADIAA